MKATKTGNENFYKAKFYQEQETENKPEIVTVSKTNDIVVRGSGDPNAEDRVYKKAIDVLYAVVYLSLLQEKILNGQ